MFAFNAMCKFLNDVDFVARQKYYSKYNLLWNCNHIHSSCNGTQGNDLVTVV